MVAALMRQQQQNGNAISAVCVGADRVVANGDTANKIGTYQAAIVARHHRVPFYVVAPSTSIDLTRRTGEEIVIEQRPAHEMTHIKGTQIAPTGNKVRSQKYTIDDCGNGIDNRVRSIKYAINDCCSSTLPLM